MITATFIKDIVGQRASQKLWHLSQGVPFGWGEPMQLTEYVITSATNVIFSGDETYMFPANADGDITNWVEMDGSYRGDLNHERAIRKAGWIPLEFGE